VNSASGRDLECIGHMLDSIARVRRFVGRRRKPAFVANVLVQDAVIHNIAIVGEAANHLSPGLVAASPSIPWRRIVGMRNLLIHGYFNVDLDVVWRVVTVDLPELEKNLRALLPASKATGKRRARRR
jgi:uncharacterized protein with HEPN domain